MDTTGATGFFIAILSSALTIPLSLYLLVLAGRWKRRQRRP